MESYVNNKALVSNDCNMQYAEYDVALHKDNSILPVIWPASGPADQWNVGSGIEIVAIC